MSEMPLATVVVALRRWAQGSLPATAAVDFLINTGQVGRATWCGLVKTEWNGVEPVAYMDSDDGWQDRAGGYSGGEYAILTLAASMRHGELEAHYWRLDGTNKTAFRAALERGAH